MIRINHAILHVFDFETGSAYLSDEELPLNERQTKSYVQRHLRRITASAESRHAEFAEGSLFAEQLAAYLAGGLAFATGEPVALSCTGATASRDYIPGLTEAYYRGLPVIARGRDRGPARCCRHELVRGHRAAAARIVRA